MFSHTPSSQWSYRLLDEYQHRLELVTAGCIRCRRMWYLFVKILSVIFLIQGVLFFFPFSNSELRDVAWVCTGLSGIITATLLCSYICVLYTIGERKFYQALIQILQEGIDQKEDDKILRVRINNERKCTSYSVFKIMTQNYFYTTITFLILFLNIFFFVVLK